MKSHARVVVVGGGIYGCSLVYHLTSMGWKDVVLIEKGELTSGQTWHAAGLVSHFAYDINTMHINRESIELYKRLEAETGQATGWHTSGTLRLAISNHEVDATQATIAWARSVGTNLEVISPQRAKELLPFLSLDGVQSAIITPDDGYVDPASVTQAMALGARNQGATIYRNTTVTSLELKPGGEWLVRTNQGEIQAQIVVNAAGCFSPAVGAMVGLKVPVMVMEHQYIITGAIPEVIEYGKEFPTLRDSRSSMYMRREHQGMCFGPYETANAKPFAPDGMPPDFGQELLPNDLDRIQEWLEKSVESLPCLANAGVKRAINGPQSFVPGGGMLMGPAPGVPNYWLACGASIGITQGGGGGKMLAQYMIEGEAEIDMRQFDPARFGAFATKEYTLAKVIDTYECLYHTHCPYEEREAGRPVFKDPLYERLKSEGAVFGESFGWERANWFAPEGMDAKDVLSFRRTNWHGPVGEECRAVRERIGVLNLSCFSKFEVTGQGAADFLDRIVARTVPTATGRVSLVHALNDKGGVACEFTVTKLAENFFYLICGSTARIHDLDWLSRALPNDGTVAIRDVTENWGVLVVTGPKSRKVLSKLTTADLSNERFPWLTASEVEVSGIPVRALRVSYAGELGWELHVPLGRLAELYDVVMKAGAEFEIANFGMRALNSLRLEKAYRAVGTELTKSKTLDAAGLATFSSLKKGSYPGRAAVQAYRSHPSGRTLAYLKIDAIDTDAVGDEPVYANAVHVGNVTSGGYGHSTGSSLAFAYIDPRHNVPGNRLAVQILGRSLNCTVLHDAVHDPSNSRLTS